MATALTFALPAPSASAATRAKVENNAWDQDPRVRAVIEELLLDQSLHQPRNTTRAYAPKQQEWRDWCATRYPPVPPGWSAWVPWDGSPLPGDLVDEGKLLLFMTAIAKRAPRAGKRLAAEQQRRAAARRDPDESDYYEPDPDGEGFAPSRLKLQYNSVRSYISAIQRLYEEQKTRGLNPAPRPQGIALKALKENILRKTWARRRSERADRGEGTIKDSYAPSQIPDHTTVVWQERKAIGCAFRTQVDFLLGNHMLLRSSNRLPIELADCFCLDLQNEGTQRSQDPYPTKALVILMRQGKTNQHGRMEYGAALRHRDPKACLISALAFWFFWRWQCEGEPFPRFTRSEDWYDIKVLRQSKDNVTAQLSSQTANSWTRRTYEKCGIITSKASHAPRVASSQNADLAGVSEASIRRAGRWTNSDQLTGCYLTSLPREFMRATADFDPDWPGAYYIPRATVVPPPSLAAAVWPEVDSRRARLESKEVEQNKAAGAFLELLDWLRLVLLQDAPFLMAAFPDHPIFECPIFHSLEFSVFAARVREASRGVQEDPRSVAIEKAIPAVSEKLRTLATQLSTTESLGKQRYHEVLERLERLERKVDDFNQVSWNISISPNGRHASQRFQYRTQVRGQGSSPRPVTPPPPRVVLGQPARSPLEPITLNTHSNDRPPRLYRLPRNTTSIVELVQIWREGIGGMPSVSSLEQRWGARWRPVTEKAFYSTRKVIIDEVARRAAAQGLTEYEVARQMDRQKGSASLDKVMKLIRSQRKQPR